MQLDNQTLGRGKVHFSPFISGTYTPEGYRYVGNTPAFSLNVKSNTLDHFNADAGVRVKDRSVTTETNITGSLECDDIQLENMAQFFLGTQATLAQTSATAATYTQNAVKQGRFYQVGATPSLPTGVRSISSVVVTVASTPKTLGTDYTIDLETGMLGIVTGGGIADGANVLVTFDRAVKSRDQVISGTNQQKGAVWFVSANPEGAKFDYVLPYCLITPNGDFALKADADWQKFSFTLDVLQAPGLERVYIDGRPY